MSGCCRVYARYQEATMKEMLTVREVQELHEVGFSRDRQLDYAILYDGPGWYSMCDAGYYEKGKFATYSRIAVGIPGAQGFPQVVFA
jgi:hypothetical protein